MSRSSLFSSLSCIDSVLTVDELYCIKLVTAYGLGLEVREDVNQFSSLYHLMEEAHPNTAPAIAVSLLSRLGLPESTLFSLRERAQRLPPGLLVSSFPMADLIMTLYCIISKMKEKEFSLLKKIAMASFFPQGVPSTLTAAGFIGLLLRYGILSLSRFDFFFAWFEGTGYPLSRQYLRRHCHSRNLKEPNWRKLLPSVEKHIEYITLSSCKEEVFMTATQPPPPDYHYCVEKFPKVKYKDMITDENEEEKEEKDIWHTRCIGCIIFTLLITLLFIISQVFVHYFVSCTAISYIGSKAPVLIDNPCHLKSLTVGKGDSIGNYSAKVYFVTDESVNYVTRPLSVRERSSVPPLSSGIEFNYYTNDVPVYTASEGVLTYNLTVKTIGEDTGGMTSVNGCPLRLHLFNDVANYTQFRNGGYFLPLYSTDCLSVSSRSQTHVINLHLPSRGFYFVGLETESSLVMKTGISGNITDFTLSPPYIEKCLIDNNHDSCTLLGSKSFQYRHIFVQSDYANMQSVVVSLSYSNAVLFYVLLPLIGFCLLVVVIIITKSCLKRKSGREESKRMMDFKTATKV